MEIPVSKYSIVIQLKGFYSENVYIEKLSIEIDMVKIDHELLNIKEPEVTSDMNINETNIDENYVFSSEDVHYDDLNSLM